MNLYVPSELEWRARGVRLRQVTKFPYEPHTKLIVVESPTETWTMRVRVPAWTTAEARVLVNGRPLDVEPQPGSYLNLKRVWKPGDVVELEMPMRLTRHILEDDHSMQAFLYGPIVLAGQFPMGELSFDLLHKHEEPVVSKAPLAVPALADRGRTEDWITPLEGEALTFRAKGIHGEDVLLKPLNQSWQRFSVYFKVVT